MKIAHIVPESYVNQLVARRHFHLTLAHVVPRSVLYRKSYKEFSDRGDEVILDNSAFELGDNLYSSDELIDIADGINASTIMAPETFENASETIDKVSAFVDTFKRLGCKKKIFAVIHGRNIQDYIRCHQAFVNLKIDMIGFSCRLSLQSPRFTDEKNQTIKSSLIRSFIIKALKPLLKSNIHYHLLGLNHPLELLNYFDNKYIKTCDSSSAWVHGLAEIDLSEAAFRSFKKSSLSIDFAHYEFSIDRLNLIKKNIKFLDLLASFTK